MLNTKTFTLGNMKAGPGETCSGFLELAEGKFKLPAAILNGEKPGKTVLIMAGVHAGEYVGIQAAIELSEKLKINKINGTVVIMKVVCRDAFACRGGSLGLEDGKNLNREFPGDPKGTPTQQLAWAMTQEVFPAVDFCIDLHSGDDYEQLTPYVYYAGKAEERIVAMSRKMAEQVDVPYMVRSTVATGGAYNYAAHTGIPGILIERGGMGGWTMEEVRSTRRDVRNILCSLGIYEGQRDYRVYYPLDVVDIRYQAASAAGCWYPYKMPGDMIQGGEVLGTVKDYEGNVMEVCRAECDGVILYQTGSLQVLENGPMIAYGRIVKNFDDRKERITEYWAKRSESFMEQRRRELKSPLAERWLGEIRRKLPAGKKLKILDVGCGTGALLAGLTRWRNAEGYGVDISGEMIRRASEDYPDLHFQVGSSDDLDFEDNTFRIITVCSAFHHFPDQAEFIQKAADLLTPGGRLYIGVVAFPEVIRITGNVADRLLPSCKVKRPSTHEILGMFKAAGLTKFRVHKLKKLLLISAKKPLPED